MTLQTCECSPLVLQKEKSVICTANQNGSQAGCELGNPFKRDSEVNRNITIFLMCNLNFVFDVQKLKAFSIFVQPDDVPHHPERQGDAARHHRHRHRAAAANVNSPARTIRTHLFQINISIYRFCATEQVNKKTSSPSRSRPKSSSSCRCPSLGECV